MGYGNILRERFPLIKWLVNAQKSAWYPVLFAALCVISGSNNHFVYTPLVWFFCISIVFSAVFSDDNKVLMVPMLMVYYGIGQDEKNAWEMSQGNVLVSFDDGAFIQLMICLVIAFGAFVCRMIADGSIKRAFSQRKPLTIGFTAVLVASIVNGLFSPNYTPINLAYGLVCGGVMLLFYLCSTGMLEGSEDPVPYACRAMVCTAYVALFQFAVVAYRAMQIGNFFIYDKVGNIMHINRSALVLSWGFPTTIAAVFALGIPAAMYLAKNAKHSFLYYFSSLMFLLGTFIINTRSAMIIGILAMVVCCILCCIQGKNKFQNRICSTVLAVLGIAAFIYLSRDSLDALVDKLLDVMRLDSLSGARGEIWEDGICDFKNHVWLGVGFADGGFSKENTVPNFFSNMYHCILIQIPAAMGIVGIVAFAVHFFELGKLFFVKFSIDKFLIMILPFMIIGMSMVDNFFFYPNFQILYGVFLALAGTIPSDKDLKNPAKDAQIA